MGYRSPNKGYKYSYLTSSPEPPSSRNPSNEPEKVPRQSVSLDKASPAPVRCGRAQEALTCSGICSLGFSGVLSMGPDTSSRFVSVLLAISSRGVHRAVIGCLPETLIGPFSGRMWFCHRIFSDLYVVGTYPLKRFTDNFTADLYTIWLHGPLGQGFRAQGLQKAVSGVRAY